MRLSTVTLVILVLCSIGFAGDIYKEGWIDFNKNGKMDVYENPKADVNDRIDDLLGQMTMDEKAGQMVTLYGWGRVLEDEYPTEAWKKSSWKDGIANIDEQANFAHNGKHTEPADHVKFLETIQRWFVEQTRLGIPVDFTNEGIRGLCHNNCTVFPNQTGRGAAFDRDLEYKIGVVTGRQARSLGYTNVYSPILDVMQDQRWGRAVESYGESPYLVGELGLEDIRGLQEQKIVSTPKHYAVYSQPYGGKDSVRGNCQISFRDMHEIYLEPFRKAFQEGKALGTMSTYAAYDGDSVTGSHYFLTELLRKTYGFKGYVVSDSGAVLWINKIHHQTEDFKNAVAKAVNAGLNVETDFKQPSHYLVPLRAAIAEGLISEETINSRVRDVLYVKFWLGLFDNPYTGWKNAPEIVHDPQAKALAIRAARESVVLLKNKNNILPLDKAKYKQIFVCGPSADDAGLMTSRYGPHEADITTPFEGIKKAFEGHAAVLYEKGCDFTDKNFPKSDIQIHFFAGAAEQAVLEKAVDKAEKSDVIVVCLGDNDSTVGESKSRSSLDLPKIQQLLLERMVETGKPVILVMLNGRPFSINYAQSEVSAILMTFFGGQSAGQAIAECLTGDYNPGGKMPYTTPKTVGQIPMAIPYRYNSWADGGKAYVNEPLYYFGYGLSYTTFSYNDLKIKINGKGKDAAIEVSFDVKNTGSKEGDTVPQMYVSDKFASVSPFRKELRGFDRVTLKPGQQKQVVMKMTAGRDLKIMDINNEWVVEPGVFDITIADSYKDSDVKLSGSIKLAFDGTWKTINDKQKIPDANQVSQQQ